MQSLWAFVGALFSFFFLNVHRIRFIWINKITTPDVSKKKKYKRSGLEPAASRLIDCGNDHQATGTSKNIYF